MFNFSTSFISFFPSCHNTNRKSAFILLCRKSYIGNFSPSTFKFHEIPGPFGKLPYYGKMSIWNISTNYTKYKKENPGECDTFCSTLYFQMEESNFKLVSKYMMLLTTDKMT